MKKTLKNLTMSLLLIFLLWTILNNSNIVTSNLLFSFNLWVTKVFPSLFPMFVISDILINYGLCDYLGKKLSKFTKRLFNTSGASAYVLMMSMISGTPSNAIFVKELYLNKYIDEYEASKIMTFSFFTNPIFLYNFLSLILNDNKKIVLIIIFICYAVNIIIGIIFRNLYKNIKSNPIINKQSNLDFPTILVNSIKKAMNNLIMILGTISFFIMLSALLQYILNLNAFNTTILQGILEITGGLNSILTLNIPFSLKALVSTFFICFGGLSIHMQIKSIIADTNISYKLFFIARIIHALIACILISLII